MQVFANVAQDTAHFQQVLAIDDGPWLQVTRAGWSLMLNQILNGGDLSPLTRISQELIQRPACVPRLKCFDNLCNGANGRCPPGQLLEGCPCDDSEITESDCGNGYIPCCDSCGGDMGGSKCRGVSFLLPSA